MPLDAESAPVEAPPRDCMLCPRLAAYRAANAAENPGWYNGAVPSFGALSAPMLVVGMAPGVRGANRTGRPFTGDYAGVLLYETLKKFGFAEGSYGADAADGFRLRNCRVTNAVRCVPPANLPEPAEVTTCNRFLAAELAAMPRLKIVLSLGVLAHAAVLKANGLPVSRLRFRHGALHTLPDGLKLLNSYHVSRYNTSTRRLTPEMFEQVVADARTALAE
ncbi:MAG TPA: uracil-DNA glycosylase [Acetobacteraceae bacterium]|nr:uracil-DNA glycosylase [Acetobacteraceae bacterium]